MKFASTLARVRPLSTLTRVLGLVLVTTSSALGGQETFKLLASDGATEDRFGISVAISGSTAIVGAYLNDSNGSGPGSGSAYLFDVTTGQQLAQLVPSDGSDYDDFGRAVAISGSMAIVGAPKDDDNGVSSGSAYLFDVTTGQQLAKLLPSDGAVSDSFGYSVAISDSMAIVGAWGDDDNGSYSGSAYLFDVSTGLQLAKLLPSDGAAGDLFGSSVAISSNRAIVGASDDNDNGSDSGSAYLFDVTTGLQLAKLLPSDGAADDLFGFSVAISSNTAIVGSWWDDDNGFDSGSAYLFDVSTGQQIAKLLPIDGAAYDEFGHSVAISGSTAIVGAHRDGDNGLRSGSAYLFDVATGQQLAKLLPSDGAAEDTFGCSVAISGGTALIGAWRDDDSGGNSGSAYLFDGPIGVNYCSPAVTNSSGVPSTIWASGSDFAGSNNVTLTADQLPPNQFGYFLNSLTQGSIANPGGSQGTLCLAGWIGRYNPSAGYPVQSSGSTGSISITLDLTSTPTPSGAVSVMAGQTWNFQCWHRDLNPGPTSNFTDAVSITFQ